MLYEVTATPAPTYLPETTIGRFPTEQQAIAHAHAYRQAHRLFSVFVWWHATDRTKLLTFYIND